MLSMYDAESQHPCKKTSPSRFPSTIARVVADQYPVDVVLPNVRKAVSEFATFYMTAFEIAGEVIFANIP